MNELFGLLKGIAPTLATAVAGPLGGAAITALASKFGVSDSVDAVAKAIAGDPQAAQKLQRDFTQHFLIISNAGNHLRDLKNRQVLERGDAWLFLGRAVGLLH